MRVAHISDTHGIIRDIEGDFDVVVHTGDMMPNQTRGVRRVEGPYQKQWIEDHVKLMASCWSKGKPPMRAAGIEAYILIDDVLTIDGVKFYGHPWVPHYYGEWNYEIWEHEIAAKLKPVAELIESGDIDAMLAHAPAMYYLDQNGQHEHCGSKSMHDMIMGLKRPLKLYACGHIHESRGITALPSGTIYSNAALTQRIITI